MDPFGGLGGRHGLRYGRIVSFLRKSFHSILRRLRTSKKSQKISQGTKMGSQRPLQPRRSNLISDLKSVTPITCLTMCILFIWYGPFLAASETTTASKLPQTSNLTSDLKSVTPITYLSMCILFIWNGPSWQPLRPLQPPNSLGGQIGPQI